MEIFAGDVRDAFGVAAAMRDCQVVFHLAALIGIPYSYQSPDNYVETNIRGTLNILQAARSLNVERILLTSTSEVYGTARFVPITEQHPRQGQSPYSATKIGADAMADAFYHSFGLPLTIIRPFNTYGPRQSARAIIPATVVQALTGKSEIRLGSLHPTRDMVFVSDTIEGFIRIAECDQSVGSDVNIATGREVSIGELIKTILRMTSSEAQIIEDPARIRPAGSEVERLLGCPDRLYDLTGWRPAVSLLEGLEATLRWFREPGRLNHYKADLYNV